MKIFDRKRDDKLYIYIWANNDNHRSLFTQDVSLKKLIELVSEKFATIKTPSNFKGYSTYIKICQSPNRKLSESRKEIRIRGISVDEVADIILNLQNS